MNTPNEQNLIDLYESRLKQRELYLEECTLRDLAFVIHTFCNGKISFTTKEIGEIWFELEVQRSCDQDGNITYHTRLPARNSLTEY